MEIDRWEYVFRSILVILINLVTFVGNAIVLLAFYRYTSLRSIPHLFVLNLVITDFLLSITVMPFFDAAVINQGWEYGAVFCNFQGWVTVTVSVASVYTLTFVSLERKLAICNPWYHRARFNTRNVLSYFGVIWCVCLLFAATGFLSSRYVFKPELMQCMIDWHHTLWVTIYAMVFHFGLPFILLVFSNVSILRMLRKRRTVHSTVVQDVITRQTNKEKKAWKMLLAVVAVFVVCWAPYYISVGCSTLFQDSCPIPKRSQFYFVCCVGINSCVNPVLYVLLNNSFRNAIFKLLNIKSEV